MQKGSNPNITENAQKLMAVTKKAKVEKNESVIKKVKF